MLYIIVNVYKLYIYINNILLNIYVYIIARFQLK